MADPKGKFVNVRVDDTLHQAFLAKAARFGGKSEVLREFIEAFIEDRLTIQPPVTPRKESLYVTRSED